MFVVAMAVFRRTYSSTTNLRLECALLATAIVVMMLPVAQAQIPVSSGSGFLINKSGWILTNAHVVEGCDTIEVVGRGQTTTVIRHESEDFAALQVAPPPDARPLVFRTRPARLAEHVHALGYPLSDFLSEAVRVTSGSVNALTGLGGRENLLQISAPIQPGNSGGPVIDDAGLVVGITTATLAEHVYERAQNVNFALPASEALAFVSEQGIAYLQAEEIADDSMVGNVSDRVEAAAGATFLIRCLGAATAPALARPLLPSAPTMIVQRGIDVIGFDYQVLRDSAPGHCRGACEADFRCRAFTFNVRHKICFLKENAALLAHNDDAVGGYSQSLAGEVLHSGFRMRSGADSPGGDYARIRDSDFIPCFLDCVADRRCRAFAFVPATRECWLKDRVGQISPFPGVEFGLR